MGEREYRSNDPQRNRLRDSYSSGRDSNSRMYPDGRNPDFSYVDTELTLEELYEDQEIMLAAVGFYEDRSAQTTEPEPEQLTSNYLDAGWGEIGNRDNLTEEQIAAEREIAEEVLAGALMGDFNDDPTFWSDVGQIVTGLIPIAGQLGDARDLIHALDDIFNREGYRRIGSWAGLVLIVIGFIPGVGDAIKSIGRRGIRYLDGNGIIKRIGQWLGNNVISPILDLVGDITAPLVSRIKNAIRRKLDEAQEIARQLGNDVMGQPNLVTEGAGNVPSRMETTQPGRGNEPSRMDGDSRTSGTETSRYTGRAGRDTFGETRFRGLVQNRPLQELSHNEIVNAFENTPFTVDSHAVSRIKDPRTRALGANTLNDIARLLNNGNVVDAGGGDVAIQLGRLEAIVNPASNIITTIRPFRNR